MITLFQNQKPIPVDHKIENYQENEYYRPEPESFEEQVSGRPFLIIFISITVLLALIYGIVEGLLCLTS